MILRASSSVFMPQMRGSEDPPAHNPLKEYVFSPLKAAVSVQSFKGWRLLMVHDTFPVRVLVTSHVSTWAAPAPSIMYALISDGDRAVKMTSESGLPEGVWFMQLLKVCLNRINKMRESQQFNKIYPTYV